MDKDLSDIFSSEYIDIWVDDGLLYIRIGIVTVQLDKQMSQDLYLGLEKTNDKLNELKKVLKTWSEVENATA